MTMPVSLSKATCLLCLLSVASLVSAQITGPVSILYTSLPIFDRPVPGRVNATTGFARAPRVTTVVTIMNLLALPSDLSEPIDGAAITYIKSLKTAGLRVMAVVGRLSNLDPDQTGDAYVNTQVAYLENTIAAYGLDGIAVADGSDPDGGPYDYVAPIMCKILTKLKSFASGTLITLTDGFNSIYYDPNSEEGYSRDDDQMSEQMYKACPAVFAWTVIDATYLSKPFKTVAAGFGGVSKVVFGLQQEDPVSTNVTGAISALKANAAVRGFARFEKGYLSYSGPSPTEIATTQYLSNPNAPLPTFKPSPIIVTSLPYTSRPDPKSIHTTKGVVSIVNVGYMVYDPVKGYVKGYVEPKITKSAASSFNKWLKDTRARGVKVFFTLTNGNRTFIDYPADTNNVADVLARQPCDGLDIQVDLKGAVQSVSSYFAASTCTLLRYTRSRNTGMQFSLTTSASSKEYQAIMAGCGDLISHVNVLPVTKPATKPKNFYATKYGKLFGGAGKLVLGFDVTAANIKTVKGVINKELANNSGVRGVFLRKAATLIRNTTVEKAVSAAVTTAGKSIKA